MNVEFRIAKLERLLVAVSVRRTHLRTIILPVRRHQDATVGWDRLERGFRAALDSLKQQRKGPEVGFVVASR